MRGNKYLKTLQAALNFRSPKRGCYSSMFFILLIPSRWAGLVSKNNYSHPPSQWRRSGVFIVNSEHI